MCNKFGCFYLWKKRVLSSGGLTWGKFQTVINKLIGKSAIEAGLSSMEDKRLGCWFVKNENGIISKQIFAEKVLKYLWDDAFKFSREKVFDKYSNLETLIKDFTNGKGINVFAASIAEQLKQGTF